MNRFKKLIVFLKEKLKEKVLKAYYIFWVVSFSSGLYSGTQSLSIFRVSEYFYLIPLIFIFLLLLGSVYFYLKTASRERIKACRKAIIFLAVIPGVIFFICGFMISNFNLDNGDMVPEEDFSDSKVMIQVQGRASSHPVLLYGSTYFEIAVRRSKYLEVPVKGYQLSGEGDYTAKIILKDSNKKKIERDDILDIKGELYISGGDLIIRARSSNVEFMERDGMSDILYEFRQRIYRCISKTFVHNLDYRYAPLAKALVLGDRTDISKYQYDAFKKSGTAHLIAISGMHISFMALIIYLILGKTLSKSILIISILIILI